MKNGEISNEQLLVEIQNLRCEIAELKMKQVQYQHMKKELFKQKKLLKGITRAKQCLLTIADHGTAIIEVLRILCRAAEVDSINIFENFYDAVSSKVTYNHRFRWDIRDKEAQINIEQMQNLEFEFSEEMRRWLNTLSKGRVFCSLVSELPYLERRILERQGIISFILVPILIGDVLWGFMSFEDCHFERLWTESEKSLLTTMASGIGGALSRRHSEKVLSEEKERLAVTIRSLGEGVITTDMEGKILLINKTAEELTGWLQKQAMNKSLDQVFRIMDEKTRQIYKNPLKKVLRPRRINRPDNWSHTILIDKNGVEKAISDTGALIRDCDNNPIGSVVVFRDITEKLKMEEELIKAGKIESIGILAGGIAHDFNNILTIIMGNVSLAAMHIKSGNKEKALNRLVDVEKASQQAKDLTMHLLTFSKDIPHSVKTVSVANLLKDTISFALSGSNILCEFLLPDSLWFIEADEGQISQVINNIIINAQQAMPHGGIIRVKADNIISDEEHEIALRPGKYVKLCIEDTGTGIPDELMSKIFEPYFTTKPNGNGLGLATSYSIIKKHNGHMAVRSKVGEGTKFFIYLPASENNVNDKTCQEELIIHKGRVLIMDDDEAIREVVGMMLTHLGYEPSFASTGQEALEMYSSCKGKCNAFDAVIMDLTIPGGIGGREAIKMFLEFDKDLRAIASSGYSNDPVMVNYTEYGFRGAIAKPYRISELSKTLYYAITEELI